MHPTAAKNIIAIQSFESKSLPVMIAAKMLSAAIPHTRAIARLHQQKSPDLRTVSWDAEPQMAY